MLVVTANWGMSDGSLAASPSVRQVVAFRDAVHREALQAGFRRDGRYTPIERLGVVFAGDTFDGLVSTRWLDGARPWERRRQAAERHAAVLAAAWRRARRQMAWVGRLARRGLVVPAADRHGRPVLARRMRVPVDVVFLLGDRDAAVGRIGVEPALARHGIRVGTAWEGADVRIRHGAEYDPLAFQDGEPTLLQSLAVDLVSRFGAVIIARPALAGWGGRLVAALAASSPLDAPRLLRGLLARSGGAATDFVATAWHRSVDRWSSTARRDGCADEPGVIDALAGWMHAGIDGSPFGDATGRLIEALGSPLLSSTTSDDGVIEVLGHPRPTDDGDDERLVCLGRSTGEYGAGARVASVARTTPACVETTPPPAAAAFSAVAIREDGERSGAGPRWWPVGGATGASDPRFAERSILDAA